jgi:hypothetical protein
MFLALHTGRIILDFKVSEICNKNISVLMPKQLCRFPWGEMNNRSEVLDEIKRRINSRIVIIIFKFRPP